MAMTGDPTTHWGDVFEVDDAGSPLTSLRIAPETQDAAWRAGLWEDLNSQHGLLFDAWEAQHVAPPLLGEIVDELRRFKDDGPWGPVVYENLEAIVRFCEGALERGHAVDFSL